MSTSKLQLSPWHIKDVITSLHRNIYRYIYCVRWLGACSCSVQMAQSKLLQLLGVFAGANPEVGKAGTTCKGDQGIGS